VPLVRVRLSRALAVLWRHSQPQPARRFDVHIQSELGVLQHVLRQAKRCLQIGAVIIREGRRWHGGAEPLQLALIVEF